MTEIRKCGHFLGINREAGQNVRQALVRLLGLKKFAYYPVEWMVNKHPSVYQYIGSVWLEHHFGEPYKFPSVFQRKCSEWFLRSTGGVGREMAIPVQGVYLPSHLWKMENHQ